MPEMKRVPRNPGTVEVFSLFNAMGDKPGLHLPDDEDGNKFITKVSELFTRGKSSDVLLHGLRVESMFAYMVTALGHASVVKHEDTGQVYAADPEIQPPDYRIVMEDGNELFVEVKNCHKAGLSPRRSFTSEYVRKITRYASLFGKEVKMAVYWSRWSIWTLVSIDRLKRDGDKLFITMPEAIRFSEMNLLGDVMLGTTPPLVLRFGADPAKPHGRTQSGAFDFTIGSVDFFCGGTRIDGPLEQQLAYYFMNYSDWRTEEPEAKIEDDQLISFEFVATPVQLAEGQGFQILGSLSTMFSRQYDALTVSERGIERLAPSQGPEMLRMSIPMDYSSNALPLWRFIVQPSPSGVG